MDISEITGFVRPQGLHKVWSISYRSTQLLLKRYGSFCRWDKLILERGSEEVYRIELQHRYTEDHEDIGTRKEFFFNQLFREYIGDQQCFIEYLDKMMVVQGFPNRSELTRIGFEKKVVAGYEENARIIFAGETL
ncbi:MAG: hypothetical protein ACE5ES_02570 [Candidatus Nanoarchaeia archaeon]